MPLANLFVAVLVRPKRILRVVKVQRLEPFEAEHAVELLQHTVQILAHVVPAIPHVTRVQAHPQPVTVGAALDNLLELLERATHLAPLAGHRLQQHRRGIIRRQHLVERLTDERDARVCTLPHMTARVEVVVVAGQQLQTLQVLRHRPASEVNYLRLLGAQVHGVGGMGHQPAKAMLAHERSQIGYVLLVHGLRVAASGIAREERECGGSNRDRRLAHREEALGDREVASKRKVCGTRLFAHNDCPSPSSSNTCTRSITTHKRDVVGVGTKSGVRPAHVVGNDEVASLALELALRIRHEVVGFGGKSHHNPAPSSLPLGRTQLGKNILGLRELNGFQTLAVLLQLVPRWVCRRIVGDRSGANGNISIHKHPGRRIVHLLCAHDVHALDASWRIQRDGTRDQRYPRATERGLTRQGITHLAAGGIGDIANRINGLMCRARGYKHVLANHRSICGRHSLEDARHYVVHGRKLTVTHGVAGKPPAYGKNHAHATRTEHVHVVPGGGRKPHVRVHRRS